MTNLGREKDLWNDINRLTHAQLMHLLSSYDTYIQRLKHKLPAITVQEFFEIRRSLGEYQ